VVELAVLPTEPEATITVTSTRDWITDQLYVQRRREGWDDWAVEQSSSHDWRKILAAGKAIGEFSSSSWVHEIDVPTSVVATMRDPVVTGRRQTKLFERIPDAEAFQVNGAHDAVVAKADRFVPQLIRAVQSVVSRSQN
jgi:3-oxoadipate enol-lactonase